MKYWLLKSEPDVWSIENQKKAKNGISIWDGVRNYQAAKNLRSMKVGDLCFFYHSNIGKEIADPFIPMDRVKKLAADMYENLAANTDVKLDVQRTDSYGYQSTVTKSIDEIFQPVIEKEKSVQEFAYRFSRHVINDSKAT